MIDMIARAQLSIEDVLGQLQGQFMEQHPVLSAQTAGGAKHPGALSDDIRWRASQRGAVAVGQSKVRVQRPKLRDVNCEVTAAYAAPVDGSCLSWRSANVRACKVSAPEYARVVRRCADGLTISRSAVSRPFVNASSQQLGKPMSRSVNNDKRAIVRLSGEFNALLAEPLRNTAQTRQMRDLATLTCLIIVLDDAPTAGACLADEHTTIIADMAHHDISRAETPMLDQPEHMQRGLRLEPVTEEVKREAIVK